MAEKDKTHRICFVGPHYYKYTVGGSEVQMYLLAQEFLKRGWHVDYITKDVCDRTIDDGIVLWPLSLEGKGHRSRYAAFKETLARIDADIYYQRGRTLYTAWTGKVARDMRKKFVFAASMDTDCQRYKAVSRIWQKGEDNFLTKVIKSLRGLRTDRRSLAGMRAASAVLAQTSRQSEMLSRDLKIPNTVVKNIHPPPSADKIEKTDPPIVLWLATVKKWKRPHLFVKLAEQLQDLDCRFVLAGRMGDSSCRQIIENTESRLSNFSYIEDVPFERSNKLIAQASIFVNTSLPNEGFPNTFIQSWLRKVPVVSLNFNPDGLMNSDNLGCCSETFEQMLTDIRKLVEDKKQRDSMGHAARAYALREFGPKKNVEKLCAVMHNIMDN